MSRLWQSSLVVYQELLTCNLINKLINNSFETAKILSVDVQSTLILMEQIDALCRDKMSLILLFALGLLCPSITISMIDFLYYSC